MRGPTSSSRSDRPRVTDRRIRAFLIAVSSFAGAAWGVTPGQPLPSALAEIERSGLTLLYSSLLVKPELTVVAAPGRGAPEDVARRVLAPHGLTLQPIRAGVFAVVRAAGAAPPASAPPATADPLVNAEPELQEVAVYASRYRVDPQDGASTAELARADIEALPGLDQDVLRVTKYLPGTAGNGVSSRPYVRGGRQNELAVYYDGIPLFEPFHFKDFQGLLGVLDPAVVGSLDFYSGVMPARFGDRLSGALDIVPHATDGTDTWILGLSPLYASAVTTGRFDSRPVEWLAAARTSTIGLVLDNLDERVGDPDFTDALVRLELPFGDGGRAIAGFLLLDDNLDFHAADDAEVARAGYRDATGWVRAELPLTERWRLGVALSHTERHTSRRGSIARDNALGSVDDIRRHDATTLRAELTRGGQHSQLVVGTEAQHYVSEYEYRGESTFDPRFAAAFGRPQAFSFAQDLDTGGDAYALYATDAWEPAKNVTLSLGLRWDAQRYAGFDDDELSPRVLLDWRPGDDWRVRAALGRMHQSERPDELQIQDREPIFHATQRVDEAVLSAERRVHPDWWLRIEAFDKHVAHPLPIHENLLDALVPLPELEIDRVRVAPLSSRAYGLETTLRWQPAERWSGWLAYSWTQALDEFEGFDIARTWDQRNTVNAGLSWTRRPWQFSGTVQWRSGWRRNALSLVDATTGELALAPRNSLTYPRTIALDLRATYTLPLRASALHFYADVGNALNKQTPCCTAYSLEQDDGLWTLHRDFDSTFPRYALIGVNWEIP